MPFCLVFNSFLRCVGYSSKQFAAYKPGLGTAALHLGGQSADRYSTPNPVTLVTLNSNARHKAEERMQKQAGQN